MIGKNRLVKFIWLRLVRKSKQSLPKPAKKNSIKKLHRELWLDATWNINYVMFTISACLIATFGLISNSTAVIIGAMLVAPLMLPLRALAFAALEGDFPLFRKALFSIIGATILALCLSSLTGLLVNIPEFGSEALARTQPNLVDLGIAVVAGSISSFAKIRRGVSDAIAGTAIAVALMPPLCVVGLCLSQEKLFFAKGAFILYLTNLLGITLSCMIVFIVAGYAEASHALGWTFALTAILFLPLGASFLQLVRQAQLEVEITNKLIHETITVGEGVNSTKIQVDWTKKPPIVYIILQTDKEITPNQASLVEQFIRRKMGQPFELVFVVSEVKQVTSKDLLNIEQNEFKSVPNKIRQQVLPNPQNNSLEESNPEPTQPKTFDSQKNIPSQNPSIPSRTKEPENKMPYGPKRRSTKDFDEMPAENKSLPRSTPIPTLNKPAKKL